MNEAGSSGRLDFFVSHAGTDEDWATWIAQQLQNAGYTVELDVWNWAAGIDVIDATQRALDRASRVLAVWTPDYFSRIWAGMEHRVSFAAAQTEPGWLLPVVVRNCQDETIPRLYRTLIRVDLVGLAEPQARARLLDAVAGPSPPTSQLPYPGAAERGSYPGRLPPIWNVPNHNPFFTGREEQLQAVHTCLSTRSMAAIVDTDGSGGIGKSEIAVEYAWRHAADHNLVWWLDAGHQATADATLIELAVLLDVPVVGGMAGVVPALFAELKARSGWLMVLDNVADPEQLARLLPPLSGRVIVTSRNGAIVPTDQRIVVARFSRAESVRLLRRRCPWLAHQAAVRIAAIVDDLPLAVAQAGAFLAQTGMGAEEYLPRLTEHVAAPGDRTGGDVGLAATVALGLERLTGLDPAAADLLDQLALMAPDPVPLTAAADGGPFPGLVVGDPATTSEIVSNISGLGLANRDRTELQLHPRVHALIGESLAGQRRTLALGRALRLLATADPGDPGDPGRWPFYAALTPHLHAVSASLPGDPGVTATARFHHLLDLVCRYLCVIGQPQSSYDLADATYQRRRRTHGDDDPETLRWAMNRGIALNSLGQGQEARTVLAATVDRQQRVLGPDHPETLRSSACLGMTLVAIGEYEAAQRLLLNTLDRRRRALGNDAAETLQSAADLGTALDALGYHEQARQVLEDTVTRRRATLGGNHPDSLSTAFHLGLVLSSLGDYETARRVLADTTARRRTTLGRDHPDTLAAAFHFGLTLTALGDHQQAREVLDDTVTRQRLVLGRDHSDSLKSAFQLGLTLVNLGDHEAARLVLEDTVARQRKILGHDHPGPLASAYQLALALAALGNHGAAREVFDDTLGRQRRVLGPHHPETLRTEASRRGPWPSARGSI